MKKIFALLTLILIVSASSFAQRLTPSLGLGFDFSVSYSAINFAIPVEARFGDVDDNFTFRIGERISWNHGGDDSNIYYDPYFDFWLNEPEVAFTQYSTYAALRWNFIHFLDNPNGALFLGVGYYFNVNTLGRAYLNNPSIAFINNNYVYEYRSCSDRYHYDELINPISHSLRLEFGVECDFFELSLFGSFDLTSPYNWDGVHSNVYYDPYHADQVLHNDPQVSSSYLCANLGSFTEVHQAARDIGYFGMAIKFFLFSK